MFDFRAFAAAIAARFQAMSANELFRVNISGDDLWALYLASFPEGTNPIYRARTYHDGSYDRNFVRKLGNVVMINPDGTLGTIWDAIDIPHPFNVVAEALNARVRAGEIEGLFRIKETKVGYEKSIERLEDGSTHEWNHFFGYPAAKHITRDVDTVCGNAATSAQVFARGLEELQPSAIQDVLDLIEQNALYRGTEFKLNLLAFQRMQNQYIDCFGDMQSRNIVIWQGYNSPAARIRNTAIGTLLQDLSEGKELEIAVKAFERMVAPTNYKRPTALLTPAMINKATDTLRSLGLESALERRFANIGDLSVNNVIWVDNATQSHMRDGLKDLLMSEVKPDKSPKTSAQPIGIDDFLNNVLPSATMLEAFFANPLQTHLMSLTAPVHANAGSLFKWGNNFAWSYNGNITDSIQEKVKAAGGNIEADLRVSLAWFNFDDLDLHAVCPDGHIHFANKSGGGYYGNSRNILDVDMNAGSGTTRTPVENLAWIKPKDGHYRIFVHQYSKRETANVGFTMELACNGTVTQYSYDKAVTGNVECFEFEMKKGQLEKLTVNGKLIGQGISQMKWGVPTEQFVKVNTVLNSPNHWDGERTGNKHWFFILDNCRNDEPARGIYNEFLKPELEEHRKVFEVLGNKTKCLPSNEQLSGLGFSSTKRDSLTVRVTNSSFTRIYEIQF